MSYAQPGSAREAVELIKGFGHDKTVGEHYTIESSSPVPDYHLRHGIAYDNKTGTIKLARLVMTRLSGGDFSVRRASGAELFFSEEQKGVFTSSSVRDYSYVGVNPFSGEPHISPNYKHSAALEYDYKRALSDLAATYTMMEVSIKSPYSVEATEATLKRETKARTNGNRLIFEMPFDNLKLPANLRVSPYKNSSIVTGTIGIPVSVEGDRYIYGNNLPLVEKAVEMIIER